MSWLSNVGKFFTGSPEKRENVSTLRKEQEPGFQDLQNAAQGNYGQGAFGQAGKYYSDLMGNDSADYQAFAAPAMRQYNQDIAPGISEQFAGMGAGGLQSSGFRNAQMQGGTDLAERLGALRANLRQHGAQGLANLGQLGLGNYSQNMVTQPGSEGFLSQIAPAVGTALTSWAGGGFKNPFGGSSVGQQSQPYGSGANNIQSSSSASIPRSSNGFNLPKFGGQ